MIWVSKKSDSDYVAQAYRLEEYTTFECPKGYLSGYVGDWAILPLSESAYSISDSTFHRVFERINNVKEDLLCVEFCHKKHNSPCRVVSKPERRKKRTRKKTKRELRKLF